ncbi:MAG: (d)CMP kinase [Spirochaetota bacterium]|nr:(d)CMP kinase [Spirochaetota bacterium]
MNNNRIVIAVDGPAGSGKSSVSKEVAKKAGLKYIDSGAIYRTITHFLLKKFNHIDNEICNICHINNITITQVFINNGTSRTFLDGEDVSDQIREELITKYIGIVSDDPEIRGYVNALLREWAKENSIIMDGRDIGTIVFPQADLKIYLDASVDIRSERRVLEYKDKGKTVDENDIKKQIDKRDSDDKKRPFGPLKMADDAIYIDTTKMSKNEVVEKIYKLLRNLNID